MKTLFAAGQMSLVKRWVITAGVVATLFAAGEARGQFTDWTGASTSDWQDSSSWDVGVPTSSVDGYIDTSGGNQPILSGGTGFVNNLYVGESAASDPTTILTVNGGGVLTVSTATIIGDSSVSTGEIEVTGTGSTLYTGSTLATIGNNGNGTLWITNGGVFNATAAGISVGNQSGSTGTVTVDGAGSQLLLGGAASYVGNGGNGTLTVTNGGFVDGGNKSLYVGLTGNGTVDVNGGTLQNMYVLYDGRANPGNLTVENSGNLAVNSTLFVDTTGNGTSTALVDGSGTRYSGGDLQVGFYGNATMTVDHGANVTLTGGIAVANDQAGHPIFGTLTINGTGTTVTATSAVVGLNSGSGNLVVSNGAVANFTGTSGVSLGYDSGSTGNMTVDGSGSEVRMSYNIFAGRDGNGTLQVSNGGLVDMGGGDMILAYPNATVNGTVTVDGTGSGIENVRRLYVGYNGMGNFSVANGGNVSVGTVYIGKIAGSNGALLATDAGTVFNATSVTVGDSGNAALAINSSAVWDNGGGAVDIGNVLGSNGSVVVNGGVFQSISGMNVADSGNGSLAILAGGNVNVYFSVDIGVGTGAYGTAAVDGAGSQLNLLFNGFGQALTVGDAGAGALLISNSSVVDGGSSYAVVGNTTGSYGNLTISGGTMQNFVNLIVGQGGNADATVENGGNLSVWQVELGNSANATGNLTVTGANSSVTLSATSNGITVGAGGAGTMNITAGATVDNQGAQGVLAYGQAAATGNVTVDAATWKNVGTLYAGYDGTGCLTVQNGGNVTTGTVYLGYDGTGNGTLTVTGTGSNLTSVMGISVGENGNGTLNITAGGVVDNEMTEADIGYEVTGVGTALVDGGTWQNIGALNIGYYGAGNLTVQNGGTVTATWLMQLGVASTGSGNVTVTGANSTLTAAGVIVGLDGNSTLRVDDAAILDDGGQSATLGFDSGISGTAIVNGTAAWTNISTLTVGELGQGNLSVTNGASVSATGLTLGNQTGALGNVTVDGSGSIVSPGYMVVAEGGNGTVTVQNGGSLQTTSTLLGDQAGTNGTITVTGTGSNMTVNAGLTVGGSGNGTLNILSNGTVDNGGSSSTVANMPGSNGNVTVDAATWTNITALTVGEGGNGSLLVDDGGNVTAQTLVAGDANGGYGNIDITGANTAVHLTSGTATLIGNGGAADLSVSDFALLDNAGEDAQLGVQASGTGNATVNNAQWGNIGDLAVGFDGLGNLTVTNSGSLSAANIYLGEDVNTSSGLLTVTGTNSTVTAAGYVVVGNNGYGEMDILNGGNVTAAEVTISNAVGAPGNVTVNGANSILEVSGPLIVGSEDAGNLTISGGATVQTGLLSLGDDTTANGTVDVTGTNSTLTVEGAGVGVLGGGMLSVENGGTVTVTPGNSLEITVVPGSTGTVNVGGGGTLQVGGTDGITAGAGTVSFNLLGGTIKVYGSDFSTSVAATLATSTNSTIDTNGFNANWQGNLSGAGKLTKIGAGTLTLSGVNTYTGCTTVSAGRLNVTGSLVSAMTVQSGATLGGNGSVNSTVTLNTGGAIAPAFGGTSLTLGNLTWGGSTSGNATAFFTLGSGNSASLLTILGNFAKGAGTTFKFDFGGTGHGEPGSPNTYTLISFGALTDAGNGVFNISDFSYMNLGGGPMASGTFAFAGNNLTFTVVPEPAVAAALAGLMVLGAAGVRRKRKARSTMWKSL